MVLITVHGEVMVGAQVRAGDHMDIRGRCMSVSDVAAGSTAGYTSSAGGGNSGGGSNYGTVAQLALRLQV